MSVFERILDTVGSFGQGYAWTRGYGYPYGWPGQSRGPWDIYRIPRTPPTFPDPNHPASLPFPFPFPQSRRYPLPWEDCLRPPRHLPNHTSIGDCFPLPRHPHGHDLQFRVGLNEAIRRVLESNLPLQAKTDALNELLNRAKEQGISAEQPPTRRTRGQNDLGLDFLNKEETLAEIRAVKANVADLILYQGVRDKASLMQYVKENLPGADDVIAERLVRDVAARIKADYARRQQGANPPPQQNSPNQGNTQALPPGGTPGTETLPNQSTTPASPGSSFNVSSRSAFRVNFVTKYSALLSLN